MNPFEKELRKMFEHGAALADIRFVGRTCFGRLGDHNRARIEFVTNGIAKKYEGLAITVLDRREGKLDRLTLLFSDLWGRKRVDSPYLKEGVTPHLWEDGRAVDWYAYQPTAADRQMLLEAVNNYLELFQEPEQVMNQEQAGFNMEMM